MITGSLESRLVRALRPPVSRYTGRSMWCRMGAKNRDPGPEAAIRRMNRCSDDARSKDTPRTLITRE
jgi:hypothetical protein